MSNQNINSSDFDLDAPIHLPSSPISFINRILQNNCILQAFNDYESYEENDQYDTDVEFEENLEDDERMSINGDVDEDLVSADNQGEMIDIDENISDPNIRIVKYGTTDIITGDKFNYILVVNIMNIPDPNSLEIPSGGISDTELYQILLYKDIITFLANKFPRII